MSNSASVDDLESDCDGDMSLNIMLMTLMTCQFNASANAHITYPNN